MASDRQQFTRAVAHYEGLKEAGYFSVPAEFGATAIISSRFTDDDPKTESGATELTLFRDEAYALADKVRNIGKRPEVAIDASRRDITTLIQDPNITDMYMIGNGSLSALILDVEERYDWHDVSIATTHLKLGSFIQRQCGGLTRSLNVPMGLFAVSDPRRVMAAVGVDFYPKSLDDPENEKVKPIFNSETFSYADIKNIGTALRPTSPLDKESVEMTGLLNRYGNLHRRFREIKAVKEGKASHTEVAYIRMVKERFGVDLVDFYDQQRELCDEICDTIMGHNHQGEIDRLLGRAYTLLESMTMNAPFLTL